MGNEREPGSTVIIREVITPRGKTVIDPELGATHYPFNAELPPITLTPIQLSCLEFMAEGMTNKQIGAKRNVSEDSVKNTIGEQILPSLHARHRTHAVVEGLKYGFLELDRIPDMSGLPGKRRNGSTPDR